MREKAGKRKKKEGREIKRNNMGGNSLRFVVGRGEGGGGLVISCVRAAAYGISLRGYLGG